MLDYEKVDKMVENCKKLYAEIPDYCLRILACDYYLKKEKKKIMMIMMTTKYETI